MYTSGLHHSTTVDLAHGPLCFKGSGMTSTAALSKSPSARGAPPWPSTALPLPPWPPKEAARWTGPYSSQRSEVMVNSTFFFGEGVFMFSFLCLTHVCVITFDISVIESSNPEKTNGPKLGDGVIQWAEI